MAAEGEMDDLAEGVVSETGGGRHVLRFDELGGAGPGADPVGAVVCGIREGLA